MIVESAQEHRVWELLTRTFPWSAEGGLSVIATLPSDSSKAGLRYQIFEVLVPEILARLRPDYEWSTSPVQGDGGLDFLGRQEFLHDDDLRISAAITVGGQCKKRTQVSTIVDEISGSLVSMKAHHEPTFFIVAFSARVTDEQIAETEEIFKRTLQTDCHILGRGQIEGLIQGHRAVLSEVLNIGLPKREEVQEVLSYFDSLSAFPPPPLVTVNGPDRVLAGEPFRLLITVQAYSPANSETMLRWRPSGGSPPSGVSLVAPIDADTPAGTPILSSSITDNPLIRACTLELLTYAIGDVDLGQLIVGTRQEVSDEHSVTALGRVQVVDNVRPRFFERPFLSNLARLDHEYARVLAGAVVPIGVVGVGGTGKSRLCEEFAIERRRRGAQLVVARQSKTQDDPTRIIANLLLSLARDDSAINDPVDRIVQSISVYDAQVARAAQPAIRSLFDASTSASDEVTGQTTLSALVLMIAARVRAGPLIIHLQELHWCDTAVLRMFERLVWQVGTTASKSWGRKPGVLFLLEGRIHEAQGEGDRMWTTAPFESILHTLDPDPIRCSGFTPEDGLEYTRLLFEDRYSAQRLVPPALLDLQETLINDIHQSAGGNPFHTLQQVQLLKEQRIIGQNPDTGLMYMIQPLPGESRLPTAVFDSIRMRWEYLKYRQPKLALLLWASALVTDRLPGPLFRKLRDDIAEGLSSADINSAEMLWWGDSDQGDVTFRHENYFLGLRQFDVSREDRDLAITVYLEWFESSSHPGPKERLEWAQTLLRARTPDVSKARRLLRLASAAATRNGEEQLARRITLELIDLEWQGNDNTFAHFISTYDAELALIRHLLDADRDLAWRRLGQLDDRSGRYIREGQAKSARRGITLRRRQLSADTIRAQLLFNDRRPDEAVRVASDVIRDIRALRLDDDLAQHDWDILEMEAQHTHSVGLALAGEVDEALQASKEALALAEGLGSPMSNQIKSTYANILLAKDPVESELLLRVCLAAMQARPAGEEKTGLVRVDLSMALLLQAYSLGDAYDSAMVAEADEILQQVFSTSYRMGYYSDAAAASLMLGISGALTGSEDPTSWFAQAVTTAAKGGQQETLWRAHINLATSLYQGESSVTPQVRDHAAAALEIMEKSLAPYTHPDRTPRIRLLWSPLAQAVHFLIVSEDNAGIAALQKYPQLRTAFSVPSQGILREDRGGISSHEWIRVEGYDYVIF
jgi:hypothetical protein